MAKIDYKTAVIAFVSLPIFCAGDLVTAAEIASQAEWIYVVKTEPSEPDLEAEFNQWYDEIDIPDVLAVPSFRRARRAVAQSIPQFPDSPTLLIHGDADTLVPIRNSEQIFAAFKQVNVDTDFITIHDGDHGFRNPEHRKAAGIARLKWFNRYLLPHASH